MLGRMSHRFAALVVVLAAFISIASTAALWVGISDWLVASAGPRRRVAADALPTTARGWYLIDGCVRHDLAVVVTEQNVVYRLGERGPAPDETDRTYTPLAARDDCDEERPPRRVFALVEDAEATETTLGRSGPRLIAPPPIAAVVEGTIGPRVGDRGRRDRALRKMPAQVPGLTDAPLLRKGARPGDKGVAAFTAAAGLHGLLLLALGGRWLSRRRQRREALRAGQVDEAEDQFFRTETLD
jgi:hypothetical protein